MMRRIIRSITIIIILGSRHNKESGKSLIIGEELLD